ncbi:Zn-dependent exopeptidase [Coprinopsis marcescibilis]|uniref:Zn-dependent exopeptidase n=1 Tax=Coprinopsis marcescibilis TaxID=230819 RepID=A0A5C3L6P5_COPMA|nr:Zn-dependent exopeptidase [Coprinopsis marcescibilis]
MVKAWIALLSAFCATAAAYDQQVLSHTHQNANGILRRFNITGGAKETIIKIAQDHDWDLWHVGKTHVDIFWRENGEDLPLVLQDIPHTTSVLPLSPQLSVESVQWNLETLNNSTFHATYHPLDEINLFLEELAEMNPDTAMLQRIGLSAEGKDIVALTITNDVKGDRISAEGKKKKKKKKAPHLTDKLDFVILGAQHAREWVASSTALYVAHALTVNTSSDEPHALSSLLDVYNFHIIPVPNPDGYVYTWESDRYWYKNRQIVAPHSKCAGLDMNRNWGHHWEPEPVPGHPNPAEPVDPCSHWYPGSRPFESPEVNSIANFLSTLHFPVAFVDLRSYGQMISSPYSYSCKRVPKDGEDQAEAAFGVVHAIKDVHEVHFQAGRLCETLYEAPGNVVDWAYARVGIKYSYVAHLRDTGTYGFSLPDKYIRPVGEETSGMVQYLAKFIATKMDRKF